MKFRILLAALVGVIGALVGTGLVLAAHPAKFDLKFGGLLGKSEIPDADPDGRGTATATLVDPDTVCFALTVNGIGVPTAAHIHKGRSHENGPIVVPITPPLGGNPGTSSGCVSGVSEDLMADLRFHPERYYWNVHTGEFPGGAVRGQVINLPR